MPNNISRVLSTPSDGMIKQAIEKILEREKYMVVTFSISKGKVNMERFSCDFPTGDFNKAVNLLQDDLTEELEILQAPKPKLAIAHD